MSIRFKWTLWFLILMALALTSQGLIVHERVKRELEKHLLSDLAVRAGLLGNLVEENLIRAGDVRVAAQFALVPKMQEPGVRVRVALLDGKIVFDSELGLRSPPQLPPESMVAAQNVEHAWQSSGTYYAAVPIHGFSRPVGVLECSASQRTFVLTLGLLSRALWGSLLAVSTVGIVLAFLISSALVKPIRKLGEATERLSRGTWHGRVGIHGSDELGQLAKQIEDMAEKLQSQFKTIEAEKTTFQALLTSMIDGLIVLDEEWCIQFLNPQAERTLRVRSEEVSGKRLEAAWPLKQVHELVEESLKQSSVVSREIALPYNVLKVYVVPMAPVTGASAMLIFRDITELRRLEETRNQFLGQVSHELRTPLTIVKGYVVTLLDDPRLADIPEDIKKILLRIEQESDRLSVMVEELLELSRLRAGKSALTFAPVFLEELVFDTVEGMRQHAERYQITLEPKIEGEIPSILGDARGLKRVILNLLDNALKYSSQGSRVQVQLSGYPDRAVLQIVDQGSGISKEDLPHIFERFFQGKKREEGKGWGLGLPIVKEIVESHEGKIRIESQEQKGTTVTVILPAEGVQIDEREP